MTTQRITKSLVDRLKSGCIVWDNDCRGFGVRRQVRDASYVLKVRVHGRQRFLTIGKHGAPWTPETARMRARRLLGEIAEGKDRPLYATQNGQCQTSKNSRIAI